MSNVFNKYFAVMHVDTKQLSCAGRSFVPQVHFNQHVHIFATLQAAKAAATKFNNQSHCPTRKSFKVVVIRHEICEDDPTALNNSVYQ